MEISGLHVPAALPLLKDPAGTQWIGGGLVSRTGLNGCGKEKSVLLLPGIERRFLSRPNHSLVTILTELSWYIVTGK
jgi:hypothetical protein